MYQFNETTASAGRTVGAKGVTISMCQALQENGKLSIQLSTRYQAFPRLYFFFISAYVGGNIDRSQICQKTLGAVSSPYFKSQIPADRIAKE